tara:strand:+ start:214 stop:420 length:207 start_codon:yes stop_codon:yes gene_type:complete
LKIARVNIVNLSRSISQNRCDLRRLEGRRSFAIYMRRRGCSIAHRVKEKEKDREKRATHLNGVCKNAL